MVEKDVVVGTFTNIKLSGAATTLQKAQAIELVDDLIAATKQARMRANTGGGGGRQGGRGHHRRT